MMSTYLLRKVGEHVYGYAWKLPLLMALLAGGVLALVIFTASLRHSRRAVPNMRVFPGVLAALIVPICVLGLAPERYAPISELLSSPPTRPVGLYADLIGILLVVTALVLGLGAWAIAGLNEEGLGGPSTRWHQSARLLLIVALGGGLAAGSGRYVSRITRIRTLPVGGAAYTHPVHVGYEFTPRTELVQGVPHPRMLNPERTPIPMDRYSGWRVTSPRFRAASAGAYRARVRYECESLDLWVEREVSLVAEEERGDPLFAPKLGDTWRYQEYSIPQKLAGLAVQGRAALPPTPRAGATLEVTGEQLEDGLHYLQLKVTQTTSREYFLAECGSETLLFSANMEPLGMAVKREKTALFLPPPDHVPCRLQFLEDHGLCACSPPQTSPLRPGGLTYCEGVGVQRRMSAGEQLGLALASVMTGGVAAIALVAGEGDSGYRSSLVLKQWVGGAGQARYAPPLPPEASMRADSPFSDRYAQQVRTVLLRQSAALRRCATIGGRRQLWLLLIVDKDGAVMHAAPASNAPVDTRPELCAVPMVKQQQLPIPLSGPVALTLSLSL